VSQAVHRRSHRASSMGYSLIELTIVIVILGILASVAGSRFFSQQPFTERGYADELAAALRSTRKVAVSSGCPARLTLGASTYAVAQQAASGNACNPADSTWSTPVRSLDGALLQGSAPSGLTVSPTGVFQSDGQGKLVASPGTTLTVGARQITIDANTGFVQVQ
jgi:MSHA pilin protein MshC